MYPFEKWSKYKRGLTFKEIYPASFGNLAGKPHLGIDIMTPIGTPILAPEDGVAVKQEGNDIGNAIYFQGKKLIRFMHLNAYGKLGPVSKGEIIGYTGNTGRSTGPHCHIDVSKGKLNIYDVNTFIDPEVYFLMEPIKITVLTPETIDLSEAEKWLKSKGADVQITQVIFNETPVWKNYTADTCNVDENWTDLMAYYATGADILALVTNDWRAPGVLGYAKTEQRLGQFRAYISGVTQGTTSMILGEMYRPAQAKILCHELCHIFYLSTGQVDKTHELDYSKQVDKLLVEVDFEKVPRFKLRGAKRLFKIDGTKIEERIVTDSTAGLFASGYNYWLKKFGFTEDIPKL